MKYYYYIILGLIALSACRKKPDPVKPQEASETGIITLTFENMINGATLELGARKYVNLNGDSFSITRYRYFVSNISLYNSDGGEFAERESYHLVDEEKPDSKKFFIHHVPEGNYVKIRFLIGVDSARNTTGAQTGALEPNTGMFWDWNTGYIMAMLEGTTNKSEDGLVFHMGGYKSPNNVLRWVTLNLPAPAVASQARTPNLHITSDIAEWFKTPNTIDFTKLSFAMGGKEAVTIADNYADMFTVTHVD